MTDYSKIPFDLVANDSYRFYKLYIDGKCQFDEFYDMVVSSIKERRDFEGMVALMDAFSAQLMLPDTKFKHINGLHRTDVWEFKKKNLRVYVIKDEPEIIIVMGGHKSTQKKDIKILDRDTKDFTNIKSI